MVLEADNTNYYDSPEPWHGEAKQKNWFINFIQLSCMFSLEEYATCSDDDDDDENIDAQCE